MPNKRNRPALQEHFRLPDAMSYLGMSARAIRKHLYEIHDLEPDAFDRQGRLLFTRENLDEFRLRKRSRGRPPADY